MSNIVVDALRSEYIRVRNRWDSAQKRWEHARRQVAHEQELISQASDEMTDLEAAIHAAGGKLPPPVEEMQVKDIPGHGEEAKLPA